MSDLVERAMRAAAVEAGCELPCPADYGLCHCRTVVDAVVDLVLEDAASVADGYTPRWIDAEECAAAIRSLKIEQGDG